MAHYANKGTADTLFHAYSGDPLHETLLYRTETEFGFLNEDGSKTYVFGEGFTYDQAAGGFTGGTVKSLWHYTAGGFFIDEIDGLAIDAAALQDLIEGLAPARGFGNGLTQALLGGDDLVDLRYRGGAKAGDLFTGHDGDDTVLSGGGNDTIGGGAGNDWLILGLGADIGHGGSGNDRIAGRGGGDTMRGGVGNDSLSGQVGNDSIAGQAGADRILGGIGNDTLSGGMGPDTFVFHGGNYLAFGEDVITDFQVGIDHLRLLGPNAPQVTDYSNTADGALIETDRGSILLVGVDANIDPLADLLA